jgi:two-component system KDP operon response regulator KdpE
MTPRAGPLRVLIVDDEPAIVRFLSASLESEGYLVSAAGDARTALDIVRRGAADLLVLDLGLPDMDGLDVVKRIRESGASYRSSYFQAGKRKAPRSKRSIAAPTIT